MPSFKDILEGLKALPKLMYSFLNTYFPVFWLSLISISVSIIIGYGVEWLLFLIGLGDPAHIFLKVCITLSQIYMLAVCAHENSTNEMKPFDGYFIVSIFIIYYWWTL